VRPTVEQIVALLGLEALPVEGGLIRQSWRGEAAVAADGSTRPLGTVIYGLLTDEPGSFSAIHRLPIDEVWYFHAGDPLQLLLLQPDGSVGRPVLGTDLVAGQRPQVVVPAGVWMGATVAPGGTYTLFGTSMAPGFTERDYEGGGLDLVDRYPAAAAAIRALVRVGAPRRMA
jgi:predicted cupin superfamily sugar epimerase